MIEIQELQKSFGDFRAVHGVLWGFEICGVPRALANVSYPEAPSGDLAAHYGWKVDAFGHLVGVQGASI